MWCWDGIRWKSFLEKRKSRNFVIEAKEKEKIENNILVIYQIWLSGSRFMAGESASFFI